MPHIPEAHLLEDGCSEVVDLQPLRRAPNVAEVEAVAVGEAHANLAALKAAGGSGRTNFILMRSAAGVVKLSMTHAPVYASLVRLVGAKRAAGERDPGVTIQELVSDLGVEPNALNSVLVSLRRNGALISRRSYVGYQGVRSYHYPTPQGELLFAIAERLGPGVQITVGGRANAWRGRNQGEPPNLFHYASLLSKTGSKLGEVS